MDRQTDMTKEVNGEQQTEDVSLCSFCGSNQLRQK